MRAKRAALTPKLEALLVLSGDIQAQAEELDQLLLEEERRLVSENKQIQVLEARRRINRSSLDLSVNTPHIDPRYRIAFDTVVVTSEVLCNIQIK